MWPAHEELNGLNRKCWTNEEGMNVACAAVAKDTFRRIANTYLRNVHLHKEALATLSLRVTRIPLTNGPPKWQERDTLKK